MNRDWKVENRTKSAEEANATFGKYKANLTRLMSKPVPPKARALLRSMVKKGYTAEDAVLAREIKAIESGTSVSSLFDSMIDDLADDYQHFSLALLSKYQTHGMENFLAHKIANVTGIAVSSMPVVADLRSQNAINFDQLTSQIPSDLHTSEANRASAESLLESARADLAARNLLPSQ